MSALFLFRFGAFDLRVLLAWRGDGVGVDDGMEAVARTRRTATSDSNDSSVGSANSSRKKGWRERFSEGDGERIASWGFR